MTAPDNQQMLVGGISFSQKLQHRQSLPNAIVSSNMQPINGSQVQ